MRIAFVTTQSDSMGGSHVHVRDVSSALVREGHEVKVFVGGTGPFTEQLSANGVAFHSLTHMVRPLAPSSDLKAIGELSRALLDFAPEIVSTHSSKAGIVGRMAGRKAKLPTLFTAHGWSFTEGVGRSAALFERVERMVAKKGGTIVCVAEADRQLAIDRNVARPEQLVTIHNGMPDYPERANPGEGVPMIVSVARLDTQKDHPTLFRALAKIKDKPWTLELVGGGSRKEEFEGLARELGILERITFHGVQTNVRPFLSRAAVFALISNYEGFPRSTVEAMRTGLPALVSDVGGSREAIVEGETGFSVPRGDADAVAAKLGQILDSAELRTRMGVGARTRYESEFTFESMFEKTKRVYRDVIARGV
ncbi:glycosyltransferase family 1 protein [bacterium]|nr:MAG: glycosyltransferase family 1 protein [bacterium]